MVTYDGFNMGYQALLFCTDEKSARTITQVLSDLDFAVESCTEPFAAVKKLMGQHFDAVVVDCDNEQNASLLFKSARNSAPNQASLAVAVVEGQVGVAKAFRLGANLVLTKPINVEQSKGTLRVARGLLRKNEVAKPAVASAPLEKTPHSAPILPAKPATPDGETPVSATRPPAVMAKSAAAAWPSVPSSPVPTQPSLSAKIEEPLEDRTAQAAGTGTPGPITTGAVDSVPSGFQTGGAASAPAPARIREEIPPASSSTEHTVEESAAAPSQEPHAEPSTAFGAEPSLTFGGAAVQPESGHKGKKVLFGIAAAALIAAAAYISWTYYGNPLAPKANPPAHAPTPATVQPQAAPPALTQTAPPQAPAATSLEANPAASLPSTPKPVEAAVVPAEVTPKPPAIPTATSKSAAPVAERESAAPQPAPKRVASGSTTISTKPAAADAAAPNVIGMTAPGVTAIPPVLATSPVTAPAPTLQTLKISQGVSQGLLIKQVVPNYPAIAMQSRTEGSVSILVTIGKNGGIAQTKVLRGDPRLTSAAVAAVKQWKYKPYLLNGQPVEVQTEVTVNFKLPN